jgi:hypothetical protein
MATKPLLSEQIKVIMDENTLDDLKSLMARRHSLNRCNVCLIYVFHFVQSAGILTTTIATGYSLTYLIWVGVGLNVLASLLNVYEKTNGNLLKTYLKDIDAIKAGTFTDEGAVEKPIEAAPHTPKNEHSKEATNVTVKPNVDA